MRGPFRIETKQYGIVYKHRLILYNSEVGFKVSPSATPPDWMVHRRDVGNNGFVMQSAATSVKVTEERVLDPRLPRAATRHTN